MPECRIEKTDAVKCAQQDFLDENGQKKQFLFLQFYKTVIGHQAREQMSAHILLVIVLEAVKTARVEQDKNDHNLCISYTVRLVTKPGLLVFNHIFFLLQRKFLAKIIGYTINFRNFRL